MKSIYTIRLYIATPHHPAHYMLTLGLDAVLLQTPIRNIFRVARLCYIHIIYAVIPLLSIELYVSSHKRAAEQHPASHLQSLYTMLYNTVSYVYVYKLYHGKCQLSEMVCV